MSTLGSVMNSSLSSLAANQLAMSVAANNIANANTPGYTRERLVVAPAALDEKFPAIGMGVQVMRVQALRDMMVELRLRQQTSAKSGDDTLAKTLSDIEVLFNDTDADSPGLLKAMTNFFDSFHTLSQDPASLNFREEVKINAQALIDELHSRNADLKALQTGVNNAIRPQVDQLNQLTRQIADLSGEIKKLEIDGRTANDLRDRRGELVKQLSEIIDVNELESDGDYQLNTKDSQLLVFNGVQRTLAVSDITSNIGNGSMKANLELRDSYIPKYLDALDQIAYELAQNVNQAHVAGYDLDGDTGNNFFGPLASASDASRLIGLSAAVQANVRNIAASAQSTGNDNQVAMQIGNLLTNPVFTGGSITDQYRSLIFAVGSDLSNTRSNVSAHESIISQLENRRQSVSGVSVDEEAASVLQFQRAYQASAKMIQMVDELLQTTLGMVGA
jgi:flagellar hook-associated protein 1